MNFQQKLIDYIKSTKGVSLDANREYYRRIDFVNGKFIYRSGDTLANEDDENREIPEEEVFRIVQEKFVYDSQHAPFSTKKIETDEELYNYVVKFAYS